jgi:hypothetical protein
MVAVTVARVLVTNPVGNSKDMAVYKAWGQIALFYGVASPRFAELGQRAN